MKTSLLPSTATKPKPFFGSYHLTWPSTSSAGPVGRSKERSRGGGLLPNRGPREGSAVLVSTAVISVIWGPFAPCPTRTVKVVPDSSAACPAASTILMCRNASPDPSVNSTNPNPFSPLNHFTLACRSGPVGTGREASRTGRSNDRGGGRPNDGGGSGGSSEYPRRRSRKSLPRPIFNLSSRSGLNHRTSREYAPDGKSRNERTFPWVAARPLTQPRGLK